jgi:hypothetical protein
MTATQTNSEFLDEERLQKIGSVNEVLLYSGGYWIHRRKESIKVIDETAVHRTVSVDFTLPEVTDEGPFDAVIQLPDGGEPVYCPPLFVLPKTSNELMSFDLKSQSGISLPLMTRRDNARISGATLVALAARVLGPWPLSPSLATRLKDLATAETVKPVAAERLLRVEASDPDFEQLQVLRDDSVFLWWLWTLAHSSLVGVPYRDPTVRRKIFALSYVESFESALRVRTRMGWSPYKVVIDSSWIAARNFHFEAEAPPGLRIADATLADDYEPATRDGGFLRRVHLSRYEASQAGAGTAILDLRVNGQGFVGGALLASGLVMAAVFGCLLHAENIAKSPTSAPAALLLLPGVIATYVGRPDQHALTTRLLSCARWLLLMAGLAAYGCAAIVALGGEKPKGAALEHRVTHLKLAFWISGAVALTSFTGLAIGWLLAKPAVRGFLRQLITFDWVRSMWNELGRSRFARSAALPLSGDALFEVVKLEQSALLDLEDSLHEGVSTGEVSTDVSRELAFFRYDRLSTWVVGLDVVEVEGEVELRIHGRCFPRLFAVPIRPLLLRCEERAAGRRLELFAASLKSPMQQQTAQDLS